jgi:ATP-dependent Lon protease
MDNLRNDMFSTGFGFVVDYLAEVLRSLRSYDFSDRYQDRFTLSSDISTRDRDGINKTFSGLMKILFPHGGETEEEVEEILRFSMEGRKRVKDQLMRVDSTYATVNFSYQSAGGENQQVTTLEEEEYPAYYHKKINDEDDVKDVDLAVPEGFAAVKSQPVASAPQVILEEKHITFQENQKGVSYELLFGPYLKDATKITITDPYIRLFYQIRNLMELLELIVKTKAEEDEISVHLVTSRDEFKGELQDDSFEKMRSSADTVGINFTWEFDETGTIHARHIVTDTGWKISLDRGLDIFQHYEMNDVFAFANRLQKSRSSKAFEATFIRYNSNQ